MQALYRLLETIRLQLAGLSLNAKLLIGSLMVILVMSLFLVSLYAGRRDMVALNLPGDLSPEAKAKAVGFLQTRDIPYEEQAGDILVPSDRRTVVLAQLVDYQLLAADQINFEKLIENDSPFISRHQNDRRYLIAKMNELSAMVRQFRGINNAKVVIDDASNGRGIGAARIPPTASVTVWSEGGELSPSQVDSIANLVVGAHAGLDVENVRVTNAVTGQLHQTRGEDRRATMRNLEAKLAAEKHARETLIDALSFLPGVRVNVNATVDTREVIQNTTNFEDPKLGVTEEESRSLNSARRPPAAEPGVRSNTGASLAAIASAQTVTDERNSSRTVPAFPNSTSRIHDTRGQALVINASIGVPRSYFVSVYKATQGVDAEPDAQTLEQFASAERQRIAEYVMPLIDTSAVDGAKPGEVKVEMFHDVMLAGFNGGANGPSGGGGGANGAGSAGFGGLPVNEGLVKYVGLSGLALVSLAMMLFMVRKATTHEELPTAEEIVGIPPALADTDSDLIGEAEETAPALEGLEIDEDQIRRQEMLGQIAGMVKETPDEAAHLLRKWIQESNR